MTPEEIAAQPQTKEEIAAAPVTTTTTVGELKRLSRIRFVLFSAGALFAGIQTGLAGADWKTADTQARVMICVGIMGGWSVALLAYIDKTYAKLAQGHDPVVDGDMSNLQNRR